MTSQSRVQNQPNWSMPRWSAPASFASRTSSVWNRFYSLTLLVTLVGMCGQASANQLSCIEEGTFDPMMDYFPDKADITESNNWNISYHGHYKVVANIYADESYVLTMCGASPPDAALVPEGAKHFQIPLNSVAVDETIGATTLELLGLRTKVRYMGSMAYVSSPCLLAMEKGGMLDSFESPGSWGGDAAVRAAQIDKVDAIIGGNSKNPDEPKQLSFSATPDPGSLKRAEWIKFLAVFFNIEDVAQALYQESKNRYHCHSAAAKKASADSKAPKVAWVNYDTWSFPDAPFVVQDTAYKMQYIRDAGGVPASETVKTFATAEKFMEFLSDVDVVIDDNIPKFSLRDVMELYKITASQADKFWRTDRLIKPAGDYYGSDFFESKMPEPDVCLEDIISILHPGLQEHQRYWFRKVSEPRIDVTTYKCPSVHTPLVLKHDGCPHLDEKDSCKGHCNKMATSKICWCDTLCSAQGDCCDDIEDHCQFKLTSCAENCGGQDKSEKCWCDSLCHSNGDCCHDFYDTCAHLHDVADSSQGICAGSCSAKKASSLFPKGFCFCDSECDDMGDCCPGFDYDQDCAN